MTSFAFILGVLPLLTAKGAGSEMRHALGYAVFYGMIGVTFFGLFLTPVFYFVIRWVSIRIFGGKPYTHARGHPAPAPLAPPAAAQKTGGFPVLTNDH
jgi:multidrug efflux pump